MQENSNLEENDKLCHGIQCGLKFICSTEIKF